MMVLYGALIAYLVNFMENRQKQEENLVLTYFVYYIAATSFFWIRSDAICSEKRVEEDREHCLYVNKQDKF